MYYRARLSDVDRQSTEHAGSVRRRSWAVDEAIMSNDEQRSSRDSDPVSNSGGWSTARRRLLQAAGAGFGGLSLINFGGDVVTASEACANGPFERTYAGASVNLGDIRAEQVRGADDGPVFTAASPKSDAELAAMRQRARDADGPQPPQTVSQESGDGTGILDIRTEYDGVTAEETRGGVPSDSQVAAGDGQLVHALNQQIAIYNKRSGEREHMIRLERLWKPVIPEPEGGFVYGIPFVFDPRARYDRNADRFVVCATQYEPGLTTDGELIDREMVEEGDVPETAISRPPQGWFVVAVSATSNPNGTWYVYRIPPIRNDGLVDYPTLGLDRDAVYLSQNFFGTSLFEVTMVTLDKAAMYAGEDVTANHFTGMNNPDDDAPFTFTVQPALQPFSGGRSGSYYLVNSGFFSDALTLWEVTDPIDDPTLSCHTVEVGPYSYPPPARQPGSDALIDTLGTRVMNADYDDGSLWTAHTVQYDWDGDGRAVAAIRWYEIDVKTRSLVQSGVYGAPGRSYFIPTVGVDDGRAVVVHNVSGPETYVRMDVAGRTADHADGELEDSVVVEEGKSWYAALDRTLQRWGDYNGVSVDPSTGRFWTVSQYSPDVDIPPEDEERDPYYTRIAEIDFDDA